MRSSVRPIFILSLPRSGSTLLQRLLAAHESVATAPEPWILLPYLYTLRNQGVTAEYGHQTVVRAIHDFCLTLPHGEADYLNEIKNLALRLYTKASPPDVTYFVDKTPPYSLIASELVSLFPEAKFVFLWRNPLAVTASIMTTWAAGKWNLHERKVDLYAGLENLVAAYETSKAQVCALRYEDLVSQPEVELQRVFSYLDLSYDPQVVARFVNVEIKGEFVDPTGVKTYQKISREPIDKWAHIHSNPFRKQWCRRYLQWIGEGRLSIMGYDMDQLLCELDTVPLSSRYLVSDLIREGLARCGLDEQKIWMKRLYKATQEIAALIPPGDTFILVDQEQWGGEVAAGRHAIPFLEKDGQYWGPPADDDTAIREFERLHQSGASFMVVGWPAFWWLDYYSGLHRHLRSKFRCVRKNSRLVVFDLRP